MREVVESNATCLPFDYDVYVFQKWMDREPVRIAKQLRVLGKQVWLDLADPLWWIEPEDFFRFLPHLNGIVVTTEAMQTAARDAIARAGQPAPHVAVIPDRMPSEAFQAVRRHEQRAEPVCLWYGWFANRIALQAMQLSFYYALKSGRRCRVRIIDNGPGEGISMGFPVEYRPWRLETFQAELLDADVVLVPPYPGRWGVLKSNNRSVTAWCAGIPTDDGWQPERLAELLGDAGLRTRVGAELRREAERDYRVEQSIADWERLISSQPAPPA